MLNKAAITDYFKRQLDDFSWLKACTTAELDAELATLEPKPDFGSIQPWAHQKACFLLLLELQRFMLFIDMGGGKTLLTLMLLKYRKQRGEHPKAIVFVPYITSVETWVEEVAKHDPTLQCVALTGSGDANRRELSGGGDLYIICYQSAVAMLSETVKDRKGKNKWQLTAAQVAKAFAGFDMLVMDEVHKAKNISSLTYRMLRAISARVPWVLGLTGTPFGRDLMELWPQFHLIDFGETLGPTLGFYREAFFNKKPKFWGGFDYTFKKTHLPKLKRIIKHSSIHYAIEELADLPEREYIVRHLAAPEAAGYCNTSMTALREAQKRQQYREIESHYLMLRQLSSGFLTLKGQDDSRLQVKFDNNPKLDALMELIEAMPHGRKMLVFHHFVYTNELISQRLTEHGVKHARIWGGQTDPIGQLRQFKDDPNCTVLVINSRSGSSSLNLQLANYVVFFEQPDSAIDRQQAERRSWRPGQVWRVFYYDLLVKDTLDWQLYRANKAGESLLQALLRGEVT